MKITIYHFIFFFVMSASCSSGQVQSPVFEKTLETLISNTVDTLSIAQLNERMKEEHLVLLDAREKKEFDVSHLENARWVGYDDFAMARVKNIPKESTVVIYCSVGYRSEKIGEQLKAAGYGNVLNLYGGIFEWVNQGHQVYNTTGATSQVHGYNSKWSTFIDKGEVVID